MGIFKSILKNRRDLGILLIVFLFFLAAWYLYAKEDPNDALKVVAGACLGAAASTMAILLIRLAAEPDLGRVPRNFLEAVGREIHGKGYYRSDCRFRIELKKEEGELHFSYSSHIVPAKPSVEMPAPKVNPPNGLDARPISIRYRYNGEEFTIGSNDGATIPLGEREADECCTIIYQIQDNYSGPFRDDHRWTCPVLDGFEVTVRLPAGYEIEGSVLRGDSKTIMGFSGTGNENEYRYVERKASFSQQGFQWSIKKNTDGLSADTHQ